MASGAHLQVHHSCLQGHVRQASVRRTLHSLEHLVFLSSQLHASSLSASTQQSVPADPGHVWSHTLQQTAGQQGARTSLTLLTRSSSRLSAALECITLSSSLRDTLCVSLPPSSKQLQAVHCSPGRLSVRPQGSQSCLRLGAGTGMSCKERETARVGWCQAAHGDACPKPGACDSLLSRAWQATGSHAGTSQA